ncbi:MAG: TonB-dependent receptor [Halioglobus sp.]
MIILIRPLTAATVCLGLAPTVFSSFALGQAGASQTVEEILVTAQKKTQSIQDVPISISVVSAEDIKRNLIFDFSETVALTPGVSVNAASSALASITVRGVGPGFFAQIAQGVPLFVDEVAAAQPGAVFGTMVDVERLEVLKGPQGTLYGKNAPSGAYNITTVAPSFGGVEGFALGSYSQFASNGEPTVDIRGAVNVPLVDDKVAARFAAVYADTDGAIDMINPVSQDDTTGGKKHASLRARTLFAISDQSDLNVTVNYKDLDDFYSFRAFEGIIPGTGGTNPTPAVFAEFNNREVFSPSRSQSSTEVKDIAANYRWNGENADIDFIVSFQEFDTSLVQIQTPWITDDPGKVEFDLNSEQYTAELRFSNTSDLFDYVAGIYLVDTTTESKTDITLEGDVFPNDVLEETFGAAAFGNFTYHINDQWDASLGLRYDDNKQEYNSFADLAGFNGELDEDLDFSHLSWSIKFNYFANENTTAYLAIDNAYRQGGINSYLPAIGAIGEVLNSEKIGITVQDLLSFEEEVSTAIEVGIKGSALDKRLRYNLAIFYQQFDDHIIRNPDPNDPELLVVGAIYTLAFTNAEEVVTKGVEFDVSYVINDEWFLDFRAAYFDATMEEWNNKLCSFETNDPVGELYCPQDSGNDLTIAPKWNTNTQLSYFKALESDWSLFSTVSWNWMSQSEGDGIVTDRFNDFVNFVNLNVGVRRDGLSVTLWGKNITDEMPNQLPFPTPNGDPNVAPVLTGKHNNGFEYGLSIGYDF